MIFPRASGVLLHPTSLPSDFGIGDFGAEAFNFANFLSEAGQTYWQILPLTPTGYGDSPYQSFSAFAGNTNLISPQKLFDDGFLTLEEIERKPDFPARRVDYGKVYEWKNWMLERAFETFAAKKNDLRERFEMFCAEEDSWLDDYALYRAIKLAEHQKAWFEWDAPLKMRDERALNQARETLRASIEEQKFRQWIFFRQWSELKTYCNWKRIKIVGDAPIFVALDSSDVWCNPQEFKLNDDGSPTVVAGVPPDYFSKTGQLWGNPIYDWEAMKANNFDWWIRRAKHALKTVDIVRIDHFRGFAAAWEVPGKDKTAERGEWVNVPGKELFDALKNAIGELPFWAEDLGVMTPDVESLRDEFNFPGMRILQYGFGGDLNSRDYPPNYAENSVAYTGTHDNDTVVGWFEKANPHEREFCLNFLKSDGREINWDFIRAVWESASDAAIAPMQDVFGLNSDARMNFPSSKTGNWNWQCAAEDFTPEIAARLRELTHQCQRENK